MRVLHVSDNNLNQGGAGVVAEYQMEAVRRLGHETAMVYGHVPEAVRVFKPDVLHFQTLIINAGLGGLEWAQWQGLPHLVFMHDFWSFCRNRMILRSIGDEAAGVMCPEQCDGQCDMGRQHPRVTAVVNRSPVVAYNEYQAARLTANGVRCDAVVHAGVDADFFSPPAQRPEGCRVLSSSAWFDCHWKGAPLMARAFAGSGLTVHKIAGLPRAALRDALRTGHVFLFPSSYPETWGMALLEAMACGLACVASAVDGPRCMIEDGVTGLLVPPRDEAALREATLSLVADRGRRERLGRNAVERVRAEFTLARYGADFVSLYERLVS